MDYPSFLIALAGASLWLNYNRERIPKNKKLRYPSAKNLTISELKQNFYKKKTSLKNDPGKWDAEWRIQQIYGLLDLITENEEEIFAAYQLDLGKVKSEYVLEISAVKMDIRGMIAGVQSWMKTETCKTPPWLLPGQSYIQYEPFGVVLILSPWNYPPALTFMPMCAALAAGNACIIKPSELSPNLSELISKLLPRYVDPDAVSTVLGGPEISSDLVNGDIDFCFYTGGPRVGSLIAESCGRRHIPYALELGGKSAVVIDKNCDLGVMARRVVQAKTINCGQTCLTCDYMIVIGDKARADLVTRKLKEELLFQFGRLEELKSKDYWGRIISENHCNRLNKMLDEVKQYIVYGGKGDVQSKYLEPTLVRLEADSARNFKIFQEEIFGPILPIIQLASIQDVPKFVLNGESTRNSLSFYVFSQDTENVNYLLNSISAGSFCVNDLMFQAANPYLPLGGVGQSGKGRYHGKYGFLELSHWKAVMLRSEWFDFRVRYNPESRKEWVQKAFALALSWC